MSLFDRAQPDPPPDLGFAVSTLDRAALRRDDAAWQAGALRDDTARAIVLCKDTPVLGFDGDTLEAMFPIADALSLGAAGDPLFLGVEDGAPRFAYNLEPACFDALKARPDLKLIDMRSIAMQELFAPGVINAIGTAKSMFLWHGRRSFCSSCGARTAVASSGWKRRCLSCQAEHFPRTDPVAIMLAIHGDRCLLGRAPQFPEGRYSCLAGFMEPGETIEDAVRREIFEETGVRTRRVRYLQAQPWPFPSSLMIGCLAEAVSTEISIDPAEIADARWFTRDEARQILRGEHPEGISSPPRMAIANHILHTFVDGG